MGRCASGSAAGRLSVLWGFGMKKSSLFRKWRAFGRDTTAATAVEFALVAFPFFISILAIYDISNAYMASTALENGTLRIARQIKTGEIQAQNLTPAMFRQRLCDEVSELLACDQRLQVDVRPFAQFNQANLPMPLVNADGTYNSPFQFDPGTSNQVILMRSFYLWHLATPFFGALFSNNASNSYLMTAAAAFRNEPFTAGSCSWNGTC